MEGVPADSLRDPSGLGYLEKTSQLFVGNRFGATGPANLQPIQHTFGSTFSLGRPTSQVGSRGACQVAANPHTNEVFLATTDGPIYRYLWDGQKLNENGIIDTGGPARGVAIAPDGKRLFFTTAQSTIRQWDLATDTELRPIRVSASNLHLMRFRGTSELYVAAHGDQGHVIRFALDQNDNLRMTEDIPMRFPVAVAFSPDLNEMFVSSHVPATNTSDAVIHRYAFDVVADDWNQTQSINVGASMQDIITLPLPTILAKPAPGAPPAPEPTATSQPTATPQPDPAETTAAATQAVPGGFVASTGLILLIGSALALLIILAAVAIILVIIRRTADKPRPSW